LNNRLIGRTINIVYITLVLTFLYVPMLIVCVFSFNAGKSTTAWSGFTFDWHQKLFNNASIMNALYTSLLLSVTVTFLSVIIGTLGSIAMYKYKNLTTKLTMPIVYLPVLTPEIIIGIAFMQIFSVLNVKFGINTLILSHLSFCVPFVIIIVTARLESMTTNLEEAARDLGATQWQALLHITIPELLPGIISGAALSFIMSFDDVVISFFMAGASNTTLPVKVYSMLKVGISPEINALTTITVVLTLICMILFNLNKTKND